MQPPHESPTGTASLEVPSAAHRWWLVCAIGVTLWHGLFLLQPQRLGWFGIAPYPQFIDSLALLAAGEAAEIGVDVYRPHVFDPYGRAHSYPSLWLVLGKFGLKRVDNAWLAPLTITLALLAGLLTVRPRTARETCEAWLGLCGPAMLVAVYRANNDLWIFALCAVVVPAVLASIQLGRFTAPLLIAFAGALKYYPLVGGVLLLAEPMRRERWVRIALFGVLLLTVAVGVFEDLRHFGKTQPTVGRFWSFGAPLTLREAGVPREAVTVVSLALGGSLAAAGALTCRRRRMAPMDAWQRREFLLFLLGGSLLAGCFWTGANWGYRWIFVVWLLPWSWRVSVDDSGLWRIVRWGWWLPMWLAPLLHWIANVAGGLPPHVVDGVWWLTQAIEWTWFGALTALIGGWVWQRVLALHEELPSDGRPVPL